jgi:hypothetical protein
MSHITIIINRVQPASNDPSPPNVPMAHSERPGVNYVSVTFTPDDSMSDEEIGRALRKLYKQVKDLGE